MHYFTSESEPFLRAILAAPDDVSPRLIYADWLDEQGDENAARFIRLDGLIRYRRERYGRWEVSHKRPTGKHWCLSPLPAGAGLVCELVPLGLRRQLASITVRHGFLVRVDCALSVFMRNAPALFGTHPITDVGLMNCTPHCFGQEWGWHNSNRDDLPLLSVSEFAQLPHSLFANLTLDRPLRSWVSYPTVDVAYKMLSQACVRLGRQRAAKRD